MKNYSVAIFMRKNVNIGHTHTVKERLLLYVIPANYEHDAYDFGKEKAFKAYPGFEIVYFVVKKEPVKHKHF